MELTKSISEPGTISLLYEYHIHVPYLTPDVNFDHITVNMLNTNDYADTMDKIVHLLKYNLEFDLDSL